MPTARRASEVSVLKSASASPHLRISAPTAVAGVLANGACEAAGGSPAVSKVEICHDGASGTRLFFMTQLSGVSLALAQRSWCTCGIFKQRHQCAMHQNVFHHTFHYFWLI